MYLIYIPNFFFVTISYVLSPAWRRLDERYHLRFADGETDEIDDLEPFVTYQMRKKPLTRKKYSDTIKLVYN